MSYLATTESSSLSLPELHPHLLGPREGISRERDVLLFRWHASKSGCLGVTIHPGIGISHFLPEGLLDLLPGSDWGSRLMSGFRFWSGVGEGPPSLISRPGSPLDHLHLPPTPASPPASRRRSLVVSGCLWDHLGLGFPGDDCSGISSAQDAFHGFIPRLLHQSTPD